MPEIKKSYETVFILSTKLGDDGITAAVQKFKELIAANGTVDGVDEWGKRRLAYPINKEEDGYYTLINFTSSPAFTAELDRIYNITDGVLRSLIVRKIAEEPVKPKEEPKAEPSAQPKAEPSAQPKAEPSAQPKAEPSAQPKAEPKTEEKKEA